MNRANVQTMKTIHCAVNEDDFNLMLKKSKTMNKGYLGGGVFPLSSAIKLSYSLSN